MPSTFKPYNKRSFITIKGKEVPRERCVMSLLQGVVADSPDIELASDRPYRRMPDGSLRRISIKELPKPKRVIKEAKDDQTI